MKQTYYTIETYNRRQWSDKHSCTYQHMEDAMERARELYEDYKHYQNNQNIDPIHACYRIKQTTEEIIIHDLETDWEENSERQAYYKNN